jgi:hypothetical protein
LSKKIDENCKFRQKSSKIVKSRQKHPKQA